MSAGFDDHVAQAVEAGYSVVPAAADKTPRVKWKQWQTERQGAEDFERLGHGSIWGLVTGALYGITVIDFDGAEGEETMHRLGLTPHVKTPGGYHVYVKHPGHPVKNSARKHADLPGLDTRGDGGLAWFSGRSKKGVYEPLVWPPEPIELEPELAERLFPHPQQTTERAPEGTWVGKGHGDPAALRYLEHAAQKIREAEPGSSNAVLNKVSYAVGGLIAAGQLDEDYARRALEHAGEARGAGAPAVVIASSIESGKAKPWTMTVDDAWVPAIAYKVFRSHAVPEPVPFPIEALPAPLDEFVRQGSVSLSCPPDYLGAGLLPVMGLGIGGYVRLRITETWRESALVYTALVGPPGARKSPALGLLMAPVWDAEARLDDEIKRLAEGDPDEWKDIAPPRLVVDDATIEALFGVLERNERGVILQPDELTGWVNGMGQYKGGLGRDRQHWLSIWSRSPLRVDRKKAQSHLIRDPFVTVLGGIQPEPLEDLLHGKDDGLLPRLLMARGEFVTPKFRRGAMDPAVLRGYADTWNRVRDEGMLAEEVEFTPAGIDAYEAWVNEHYETLGHLPPELAGAWAKMDGQAGRLILIMARLLGTQATEDVVDRAIALVRYFQGQAASLLQGSTSSGAWEKQQSGRLKTLARFINEHPGVTRAELMAMGPEWALDGRTLDRLLETLKDMGVWGG